MVGLYVSREIFIQILSSKTLRAVTASGELIV